MNSVLTARVQPVPRNTTTFHSSVDRGVPTYWATCECGAESPRYPVARWVHDWTDGHRGLVRYADIPVCALAAGTVEQCGHERAIADDLLGRGRWACTLPVGHDGPHGCVLGGEVCRWGDDGFALPGDPDALDIDFGAGA